MTLAWMERDRNHPSVVLWSGSNETAIWDIILGYGPQYWLRHFSLAQIKRFIRIEKPLVRRVIRFMKSLDPTRPIEFEGCRDYQGEAEIANYHYYHFSLDREWLDRLGKPLVIGEHGPYYEPATWKPDVFRRFLRTCRVRGIGGVMPFQIFRLGPRTGLQQALAKSKLGVRRPRFNWCHWGIPLTWDTLSGPYPKPRYAISLIVNPWLPALPEVILSSTPAHRAMHEALLEGFQPCAVLIEPPRTWRPGEPVLIHMVNDEPRARSLSLEWSVTGRERMLDKGGDPVEIAPFQVRTFKVTPRVEGDPPFRVRAHLRQEEHIVSTDLCTVTGAAKVRWGAHWPICIAKHANMALSDDRANDETGGWTDQGSGIDLRALPTGDIAMAGVPFHVLGPSEAGGKAAIMLRGNERPCFPEVVEGIPVNVRCRYLAFAHASAWTGSGAQRVATYRIRFADGAVVEAPIVVGQNIEDWWHTTTKLSDARLGWSGRTASGGEVGLFVMKWSNPFPDQKVSSLSLLSTGRAVAGVVAITASVIH